MPTEDQRGATGGPSHDFDVDTILSELKPDIEPRSPESVRLDRIIDLLSYHQKIDLVPLCEQVTALRREARERLVELRTIRWLLFALVVIEFSAISHWWPDWWHTPWWP